jgi:alpha-glucosidase
MNSNDTKIVMFGDSITKDGNWRELLQRDDVRNSGYSGFTTEQLLSIIDSSVLQYAPQICFFLGGINDLAMGVAVESVFENQKKIISVIRSNNIIPIMQSAMYVRFMDGLNSKVNFLDENLCDFAEQEEIDYIDLNSFLAINSNLKNEFTTDGVHLTRQAYKPWAECVLEILQKYSI